MAADLTNPIFTNEDKAREHLESLRWPNGPSCPHCGSVDKPTRLSGKSHRKGLFQCNECRGHFSVTVGSIFERSHIPLNKWLLAFHLMAASKKGISAHQLHRMLGITYKSAWFMAHRIRECMKPGDANPMGGEGKVVEADETYIGTMKGKKKAPGYAHKRTVLALVERGGKVRSFQLERPTAYEIKSVLYDHVDPKSRLHTDGAQYYKGSPVAKHESVDHSKEEYARGDVHTNTVEGIFSIFKRGMIGTYQHCGEQHLARYLAEFDFRQNNRIALGVDDKERAARAIKGAAGKRLTYRQADSAKAASLEG